VKWHSCTGIREQIDGVGPFLHRDDYALIVFFDHQRDVLAGLRRYILEFVADDFEYL